MAQFIKNRWVKIIGAGALSFLLLIICAGIALQLPSVQTKVIHYITSHISSKTGFEISINKISLRWLDRLKADDVAIYDLENNLMIQAPEIEVNYEFSALLGASEKIIDHIEINDAEVNARIISFDDSLQNLNLTEFINRLRNLSIKQNPSKPSILIDEVELKNSTFSYLDYRRDTLLSGFNYNKFRVTDINANVHDMLVHADTLQMQIIDFTANIPKNDLPVKSITGEFRISKRAMEFNEIEIHIGKSIIRDQVVMNFQSPKDLQDFNYKVDLDAHFNDAFIHSEDLALFVPLLKNVNDEYRLTGDFNGRINNFHLSNAELQLGRGTHLRGNIRMEGLPNVEETFMNYKLTQSYVLIEDMVPYLSSITIERLEPLHHLSFNGQLIGFTNDFVATGSFDTKLGHIKSDINLKLNNNADNAIYNGKLSLVNFNLGKYANHPKVGFITLTGKVNGNGLTVTNADFLMEGEIQSIDYNNYTYRNISTNGHFKNLFFDGNLEIVDPNVEISLTGSVNLKENHEKISLRSKVKKLILQPLNFSKKNIYISGNAVIDASGLSLDSLFGHGSISDSYVRVENKSLKIDTLNFYSSKKDGIREFDLYSDLLDLKFYGKFNPTHTFSSIKQLVKEYDLAIENNSEKLNEYYQIKDESETEDYMLSYEVLVKNFNPFLNLIQDSLYVASGTYLRGNITGGYTSIFNLNIESDSIRYRQNALKNSLTELSISKVSDSTDVLGMLYVQSEQQDLGPVLKTENLIFESIWNNNLIDFDFSLKQQQSSNRGYVQGDINFLKDNIQISFENSEMLLFDKEWHISEQNKISLSRGEIAFKGVELIQDHQLISINGSISRSPGASMEIKLDSVELRNFNPILLKPINGSVNGLISLRDVYTDLKMNIITSARDFEVDGFKVGNISGTIFYDDSLKQSDITTVIERNQMIIASLQGVYNSEKNLQNRFSLDARVNQAPLNILEPFLENYFTSFNGTASGNFKITGSLKKPVFEGTGTISNGGIHINYMKTDYRFAGNFSMAKNSINLDGLQLSDVENNSGYIEGSILHDNFHEFALDLNGRVNNFMVLNTTSNDNDLFYGSGYATGAVSFKGPVNNLTIAAQAKTDPGTRIFIPLNQNSQIQQQEFINFVSFTDSTTANIPVEKDIQLTGINLDLALDVTSDAYTEIIFDIKSGDIIRGRGEGDLRLTLDQTGEFNMYGDFFIREGGYNFTLYNIVNKEFDILPDSRISWFGDPYQGQMNIKATYEQLASLRPVIPQAEEMENEQLPVEIRRKYPSKVLMNLQGPLLSPQIDFDINVENLPNYQVNLEDGTPVEMNFLFSRFKDSWDEQELNRQVFSLIVLRKFSPLQSFSTGGSIASSVSELFSNQLSYWITQVNENLEIDVDLGSLDEEAFNTFQLRLSYTMFDGRLRIIRDGGFTNPYDNNEETKVPGFIGDWTVEYLLTQDGKLRVKMYNRTSYNTLEVSNQNSIITTGFSIQHIQSFDQLKDLFKKRREQKNDNADTLIQQKEARLDEHEIL